MSNLKIFQSDEFGSIRTVSIDGQPYFVGKDVASVLGYAKPENAISSHVDGEDKTTTLIQGDGSCIGFPKRESGQDRIHQHVEVVAYRRESRRKSGRPVVHG